MGKWVEMDKAILSEISIGKIWLQYYNYLQSNGFENCDEKIKPIESRLNWLQDLYEVQV